MARVLMEDMTGIVSFCGVRSGWEDYKNEIP
jgi:hypothetical protein